MEKTLAPPLQRILIVGLPGAGKSTLARRLSHELALPHIEADALYWPEPHGYEERLRLALATHDSWIFEGHYGKSRALVDPLVTRVIWIDPPYPVVLWRWFWRSLGTRDFSDWAWVWGRRRELRAMYREAANR